VIAGDVLGNAYAKERVEIAPTGRSERETSPPRAITIADGAHFKGQRRHGARVRGGAQVAGPVKADEVRRIPEMKDEAKIQGTRL